MQIIKIKKKLKEQRVSVFFNLVENLYTTCCLYGKYTVK